jgi:putative transcriptional regulator
MGLNCSRCGKPMRKAIGNHHYLESGLDNVYLENIPLYKCPDCQIEYPSFFRLGRLNDRIALTLVQKPALLTGNEIKFLRKNLRMPSHMFARQLGVGKTTLSKWENDLQKHSEGHDRLIRATYALEKGLTSEQQQTIQKFLKTISLKGSSSQSVIIAEKVQEDYVLRYEPVVESKSHGPASIDLPVGSKDVSITTTGTIMGNRIVAAKEETCLIQEPIPIVAAAQFISEGSATYATKTTEI